MIPFMPSAAKQVERDIQIREQRSLGARIADLASEHNLSETRIKQILKEESSVPTYWSANMQSKLLMTRRDQLLELYEELTETARAMPASQASAKIGAYKAAQAALDRVIRFEETSGLLPRGKVFALFA